MFNEIKKILVAVDFSKHSKKTFTYASYLAGKTGAELLVLSILNQRDVDAAAVYSRLVGSEPASVKKFTDDEIERREQKVVEVLKEIGLGDIERDIVIRVGNPFVEILNAIKEFKADLIVMGTRGTGSSAEYEILTGSVAERVFKHSPVPVLSVRD